jgi:hypothetical protein
VRENKALKLLVESGVLCCDRRYRFVLEDWFGGFAMAQHLTNDTQKAHAMIEMLPPAQLAAVVGLLESILDPVARSIANAPFDDEPVTAEEAKALEESRE